MNATKFLSEGIYIKLPFGSNVKVFLSINSKEGSKLSFKLFNPFSKKARLFKFILRIFCVHLNFLSKIVFPTLKVKKSDFICFLNTKLALEITSSLYIATAKDKYVLQLQNNNEIFGYLKFPTTNDGKKRLLNEQFAISILSKIGLVPDLILYDTYKQNPFIILKNLNGSIGDIKKDEYELILNSFKKNNKYKLINHPRIIELKNKILGSSSLHHLTNELESLSLSSSKEYFEVYEHGDFAPWNLIRTSNGIIPFDLEYFNEVGLEYMDEIKYHFQIERLINGKRDLDLISTIDSKVLIDDFHILFKIFLVKEILLKKENVESFNFEESLLKKTRIIYA